MIHIFRNEMKKWHAVLWVVFVSLALSGLSIVLFRSKTLSEISVATVNGYPIYFDQYRRSLAEIQERLNSLRPLAAAYGMSEEDFLTTFLGVSKPENLALDTCVREALMDGIKDKFKITLDSDWFGQSLIKTMPQFIDESGKINMDLYQRHLQRLSTTPAEYEKNKKEEFKREVVHSFITNTSYVPKFIARDAFDREFGAKSFAIVTFPGDHFLNEVKKEALDEKRLENYFHAHKEWYRVAEKRKARYWTMETDAYVQKVDVDPAAVQNFYDRHKGTAYRIAPKIKVRHIFIKLSPTARDVAHDLHQQLSKDSSKFAELAKKHSEDAKTAATGGVVDFFSKGTHDKDFEMAAFRLKETGEISKITKTKDGYEIIQLVDRIKAGEKSFESVKEEIEKNIRVRRAAAGIRSDLEALMRANNENDKALEQFAKQYGLKEEQTDWLSASQTREDDMSSLLAKRLFAPHKRGGSGFFNFKEQYVIYQQTGVEKSFIPSFDAVKNKVEESYRNEEAEALAKNTMKEIRASVLEKKMTLEEAVGKFGGSLTTTKVFNKAEAGKVLAWADASFREQLFTLTDQAQILEHTHSNNHYLAQLKTVELPAGVTFEGKFPQLIKQEKYKTGMLHGSAFIASLHRNAKIETDHKILDGKPSDMKDE